MTDNELYPYSGNLTWLRDRTILLVTHGSHAYGLSTPSSDVDIKGVAIPPADYFLGFNKKFEQAESKDPNDMVVYDVRKFFALAADCNPCVAAICKQTQFFSCCTSKWTPDCIAAVGAICKVGACQAFCSHSMCVPGIPLTNNCDKAPTQGSCVAKVCAKDPKCCGAEGGMWEPSCVDSVNTECGYTCTLP